MNFKLQNEGNNGPIYEDLSDDDGDHTRPEKVNNTVIEKITLQSNNENDSTDHAENDSNTTATPIVEGRNGINCPVRETGEVQPTAVETTTTNEPVIEESVTVDNVTPTTSSIIRVGNGNNCPCQRTGGQIKPVTKDMVDNNPRTTDNYTTIQLRKVGDSRGKLLHLLRQLNV